MDKASRPFVDPGLAQLKAVLLGLFLAVEDHAPDVSNFYDRAKLASAEDSPLRVPIKASCEIWNCRTSNQRILVSFDSPLFRHTVNILKLLSGVNRARTPTSPPLVPRLIMSSNPSESDQTECEQVRLMVGNRKVRDVEAQADIRATASRRI
jgi:hypothetical protein